MTPQQVRGGSSSFQGGWGWYLGAAESIGHVPKVLQFENWNLSENGFTRNTSNATK